MPERLTPAQLSHMQELIKMLGRARVAFIGFDEAERPVVQRRDANGDAIYGIAVDGIGIGPVGSVRPDFTDREVEVLSERTMNLLCSMPRRLETQPA